MPELFISRETVERLRRELPELPAARRARLQSTYRMRADDAAVLTATPGLSEFFEQAAEMSGYPALVLHLLLTDLLRLCRMEPFASPVSPEQLAELADLSGEGSVNHSTAKLLLSQLRERESPRELAARESLMQISDRAQISAWVAQAMEEQPGAVSDYRGGKTNALRALQGRVMALSRGLVNPVLAEQLLRQALHQK